MRVFFVCMLFVTAFYQSLKAESHTATGYTLACKNNNIEIWMTKTQTQPALPSIEPQKVFIYYLYNKGKTTKSGLVMFSNIQNGFVTASNMAPTVRSEISSEKRIAKIWFKSPPSEKMFEIARVTQSVTSVELPLPHVSCNAQEKAEVPSGEIESETTGPGPIHGA